MTIHDHSHGDCPNCGRAATVARPSPLWRLALAPAWIACAAMVVASSMLGFGLLLVVPFVLAGGACLLSAIHAKASEEPVCLACGKIARWPDRAHTPMRAPIPLHAQRLPDASSIARGQVA